MASQSLRKLLNESTRARAHTQTHTHILLAQFQVRTFNLAVQLNLYIYCLKTTLQPAICMDKLHVREYVYNTKIKMTNWANFISVYQRDDWLDSMDAKRNALEQISINWPELWTFIFTAVSCLAFLVNMLRNVTVIDTDMTWFKRQTQSSQK